MTDPLYDRDVEALAIAIFVESPNWPFYEVEARWRAVPEEAKAVWRARSRRLHEWVRLLTREG